MVSRLLVYLSDDDLRIYALRRDDRPTLMPDIAAPDTIFPELLLKYTPAVFAALIISGALAAAMSTGDSQLHATSTMVATDIYKNS